MTFLNEVTQEYLFYMVTFKATTSGPISTIKLTTAVRQRVTSTIKLDNPLPTSVRFTIDCKVPDVSVPPHFTVPAQSEVGAKLIQCCSPLPAVFLGVGALKR